MEVLLSDGICSPNKRLIESAGIDFGLPVQFESSPSIFISWTFAP